MNTNPETIASLVHNTRPLNIAVVGATGNVGSTLLEVLAERGIPIASLRAMASKRSAGETVECGSHQAVVEVLDDADPRGIDVALFSAGAERSLAHAKRFADAGALVIDNSSAFRGDDSIPLVVPEVNASALDSIEQGIVANPNCSTSQLMVAIHPIIEKFGLERLTITTMQSTSGTGLEAMRELESQSRIVLGVAGEEPSVYPHEIAFNVLPHCGSFLDSGATDEEQKLVNESRKILGKPNLRVAATCTRVPVFIGHSESVNLELETSASPDEIRQLLQSSPGIQVVDQPSANEYPLARDCAGQDDVFVGRIRQDESVADQRGIAMFIVADNLRKGAATNAIQILEAVAANGRWAQ